MSNLVESEADIIKALNEGTYDPYKNDRRSNYGLPDDISIYHAMTGTENADWSRRVLDSALPKQRKRVEEVIYQHSAPNEAELAVRSLPKLPDPPKAR